MICTNLDNNAVYPLLLLESNIIQLKVLENEK